MNENIEDLKLFDRLNTAVDITIDGIEYELVAKQKNVKVTDKETGKRIEAVRKVQKILNFEGFDGTVHLYRLKNKDGSDASEYKYNLANGDEKVLKTGTNEYLYCLDFRNQSKEAISVWHCKFRSDDLVLSKDNLVNAKIVSAGNSDYVLASVQANSRIAAGETLEHKIIFKAGTTTPIAHNFQLFKGDFSKPPIVTSTIDVGIKPEGKYGKEHYKVALGLAPLFFEANESGRLSPGNRVTWRKESFLNDGKDIGKDLSGGYFDAGDHLTWCHCTGFAFSNVAITMHLYRDIYKQLDQWEHYTNSLIHACDWLMKCHEYSNGITDKLHYETVHSKATHNEWTIPELARHERKTYTIDKNNRGSEAIHNTGSCLANSYLVFKDEDPEYAAKCLEHSRALFEFGVKYPGKMTTHIVYKSSSGYQDERCHHAVSLYAATGEKRYLDDANSTWSAHIGNALGWFNHLDNSSYIALFLLAIYDGNSKYINNIKWLFQAWSTGTKGVKTVDGKLRCLNDWATTTQNMGGLFAMYSHFGKKNEEYERYNLSQIDYILGDNHDNYSYLIGFGDKWMRSPHHRGSSGGLKMHEQGHNKHPLIGALIGGKKLNGYFPSDGSESRSDWVSAEVN